MIDIWVRVKIQSMDQGPGPTHDPYSMIHTPIHTPLCKAIHTPRSIPHLSMVYDVYSCVSTLGFAAIWASYPLPGSIALVPAAPVMQTPCKSRPWRKARVSD